MNKEKNRENIIGVDEAGRGPLAGPVAVGVSYIPKFYQKEIFSLLKKAGLNDSKQVKEKNREELYAILAQLKKDKKINWAVTLVSAKIISDKGIVYAVNLGIKKNLQKVFACHSTPVHHKGTSILMNQNMSTGSCNKTTRSPNKSGMTSLQKETELEMDGALKIPVGEWKKASVIIKGDSIKSSIMIASILAKVTRDRYMKKIAKTYPQYLFEIHKGYGTVKHRDLIKKYGMCEEHRVGWCKKSGQAQF